MKYLCKHCGVKFESFLGLIDIECPECKSFYFSAIINEKDQIPSDLLNPNTPKTEKDLKRLERAEKKIIRDEKKAIREQKKFERMKRKEEREKKKQLKEQKRLAKIKKESI